MLQNGFPLKADTHQSCTGFCLHGDTNVYLYDGNAIKIKDIKVGDKVLSVDIDKNFERQEATVLAIGKREVEEYYTFKLGRKRLKITGEHPVYTKEGWKEVKDLTKNDYVRWFQIHNAETKKICSEQKLGDKNPMWKPLTLQKITDAFQELSHNPSGCWVKVRYLQKIKEKITVYNFECTPNNNYLAEKYLVHNCKFCLGDEFRESVLKRNGIQQNKKVARLLDIKKFSRFVENAYQNKRTATPFMDWAIRNKGFIELGTTGETFQKEDLFFRTSYNFLKICSEYRIPLFLNTKLGLVCNNEEYFNLLADYKAPIVVCCSFSTTDDADGKILEPLTPLPSVRLKTLKALGQYSHIKTCIYASPFIPSITNKDPEKYIKDVMEAGAFCVHLRDFFIQGSIRNNYYWKQYIEKNKEFLEPFPGGYHVNYATKKKFYQKFTELGKQYNPQFEVVGMKAKWFELNPFHGKAVYDYLPKEFKDGVSDFTAIPILRKIRERLNEPQLLVYNKLGHDPKKIRLPERIRSNEGNINNVMDSRSNCSTPDVQYELTGEEWLKGVTWNGWTKDEPSGFMSELDYIFPVKGAKGYTKDEDGNYLYAYIPKEYFRLVKDESKTRLFTPTEMKEFKNPYVDILDVGKFYIPERQRGTEDKFLV